MMEDDKQNLEQLILRQQKQIINSQRRLLDELQILREEMSLANRVEQALALVKKQGYIDGSQDRVKTERSTEGRD